LGVTDKKVLSKAEEYLRTLNVKCKTKALASEAELAKSMVCLDLSCQLFGHEYKREQLIKYAGTGEKEYQVAFNMIQSVLKIRTSVSLSHLAIKMGCARVQNMAHRNLQAYQAGFREQLSNHQRATVNFQSPVYPAVALYLTALREKLKIDKAQLISTVNCLPESFESVCKTWIEMFPALKPPELIKKEKQMQKLKESNGEKPRVSYLDTRAGLPKDGIHAPPEVATADLNVIPSCAGSRTRFEAPTRPADFADDPRGPAGGPSDAEALKPLPKKRTRSELFEELSEQFGDASGPPTHIPAPPVPQAECTDPNEGTASAPGAPPSTLPPPPPPPPPPSEPSTLPQSKKLKQATLGTFFK
jgi:hypothetical protein